MALVHSFEPVIGANPRIVILGSMPGVVSLQAAKYYANPRNAFWPIMAQLFGIELDINYEQRIAQIRRHPVVLWDTIKACHREGSLDSNIQKTQLEANDVASLLKQYTDIRLIVCNGATSEKFFNQLIKPKLKTDCNVVVKRLPSTSPAYAGMTFEQKLLSWRVILDYL